MKLQGRLHKCISEVLEFDRQYGIIQENAPTLENIIYNSLALAGEAGEIANVAKKIWRDGDCQELRDRLAEETVDLVIYLCKLLIVAQIDFDEAWVKKHQVLHQRWSKKPAHERQEQLEVK